MTDIYSTIFKKPKEALKHFGDKFLKITQFSPGDRVLVLASRCSSSISSWGQQTNKNHGYVIVAGEIRADSRNNGLYIRMDEKYKSWEKPIGREREEQSVWEDYRYVLMRL